MATKTRQSPSGYTLERKGIMALASADLAVTATATATGSFAGARTGDSVIVNPRANLNGAIVLGMSRVVADDIIVVKYSNAGASTNTGAITCDVTVKRK